MVIGFRPKERKTMASPETLRFTENEEKLKGVKIVNREENEKRKERERERRKVARNSRQDFTNLFRSA